MVIAFPRASVCRGLDTTLAADLFGLSSGPENASAVAVAAAAVVSIVDLTVAAAADGGVGSES